MRANNLNWGTLLNIYPTLSNKINTSIMNPELLNLMSIDLYTFFRDFTKIQ